MRRLFLVAMAFVLGACFTPDLGNGDLVCGVDDACPLGYECGSDGKCYRLGDAPEFDAGVPANQPRAVFDTTGGGGGGSTAERSGHVSVGQSVVSREVTAGERTVTFGVFSTTTSR